MTKSDLKRDSAVMIPPPCRRRNSPARDRLLMFWNGSTAMDGLSGVAGPYLVLGRRAMRSRAYSVSADRLGDVLELLFTAILEANVQLAFDFAVHLFGNQDAARIGDPLQPDSNVDPVAVEVTVLPNDNVTKVEPDA